MATLRFRWWEGALLALPGAIAVVFLIAGQLVSGIVLAALVTVGVALRAQIPERNLAGGWTRTRSLLMFSQWAALMTIYVLVVVAFFVIHTEHWTRDRQGTVAFYALIGLSFFLVREIYRLGDTAGDYWIGSEMERKVAARLDPLREQGWFVIHDVRKDWGGNVDHYVCGPHGPCAIETKSGRNRADSRNQAIWSAVWAKDKFRQGYTTAILCVRTDPPPEPIKQGNAWVVGLDDLVPFLERGNYR